MMMMMIMMLFQYIWFLVCAKVGQLTCKCVCGLNEIKQQFNRLLLDIDFPKQNHDWSKYFKMGIYETSSVPIYHLKNNLVVI